MYRWFFRIWIAIPSDEDFAGANGAKVRFTAVNLANWDGSLNLRGL